MWDGFKFCVMDTCETSGLEEKLPIMKRKYDLFLSKRSRKNECKLQWFRTAIQTNVHGVSVFHRTLPVNLCGQRKIEEHSQEKPKFNM